MNIFKLTTVTESLLDTVLKLQREASELEARIRYLESRLLPKKPSAPGPIGSLPLYIAQEQERRRKKREEEEERK